MPVITSQYKARGAFKNTHFSTIYSAKIRRVFGVDQQRERISLPDGDFIDIDWSYSKSGEKATKVAVLFHGLEGNAHRPYMLGTSKILNKKGYDCVAVNLRGCSGSDNLNFRSYHSGATEDVDAVLQYLQKEHKYAAVYLVGFSLGGNLILKYLGEERCRPKNLVAAVAVSTPVHLYGSMLRLSEPENRIYHWSFLMDLKHKLKAKIPQFPDYVSFDDYKKIVNLRAFDEIYTAPANGFKDALDYYTQSSSLNFLPQIKVPTLLLNAANDTFLDDECFPFAFAKANKNLNLEVPKYGGHVGFFAKDNIYYNERRTLKFFEEKS